MARRVGKAQPSRGPNTLEGEAMKRSTIRTSLLFLVLAAMVPTFGCGGGPEGKYRDSSGTFNAEFSGGKAYIAMGAYAVDGTYTIKGDKLIATGDFGLMLPHTIEFTILKDGTLDPPRDSPIPRLEKVKK
jgi:hypothetical protein